ncbi:MAG TPA: hypothetical protein VF808_11810 [Ktedonobacterales bacterium]
MRTRLRGAIRLATALCAVAAVAAFGAGPALADGNGAQTQTITIKNGTIDFGQSPNPCSGTMGDLAALSVNGVLHETVNKAGDVWDTGTLTGMLQFTPNDPSQPTYTGHGVSWFGDSLNNRNAVNHFTFSLNLTGSDGSTVTFHEAGHVNSNANGIPVVVFDKQSASCG